MGFYQAWNQYFILCMKQCFSSHGGWILDNFPKTRDQMNMCIEKNVLPDDIIVLQDKDNSEFLLRRYYQINKEEIDSKIQARREEEERKRRAIEEERR